MKCGNCGMETDGNAVCPHCGAQAQDVKKFNFLSLFGIIVSVIGCVAVTVALIIDSSSQASIFLMVFFPVGLALSIAGTVKSRKLHSGKIAGIIGIILAALAIIIFTALLLLVIFIFIGIGKAFQ